MNEEFVSPGGGGFQKPSGNAEGRDRSSTNARPDWFTLIGESWQLPYHARKKKKKGNTSPAPTKIPLEIILPKGLGRG